MDIKDWPLSKRTLTVLFNAGYKTIDDLKEKTIDDLKELPGLGVKGVTEIREWCRSKFGVTFKPRPKVKKKVLKDFKGSRDVVQHLLKPPFNWANQLKVADQLIAKYGTELLLRVRPKEGIYSLVWYNIECGDKYIRQFMPGEVVQEEKKEEVTFDDPPVDFSVGEKPKSLKDFLKL